MESTFNKMNFINRTTKILAFALALLCVANIFSGSILAINEDLDNPQDNLISQNEQKTDLLSENTDNWPKVRAEAYALLDLDSGSIIMGKDYDVQRAPASTTKVMTLMLAMENLNMDDVVTITPEIAEEIKKIPGDYVKLGLQEGEQIPVRDLVYAGSLKSANDACLALAMHIAGTEAAFCDMMNKKATEIGCLNTHFSSSFGYANPDNLTTAYDLCMILGAACRDTEFSKVSTTYSYTIPATNKYSDSRKLTNANRFIRQPEFSYDYYIGGKTGFTSNAGYTLVGAAKKNDRTLVACVLKAQDSGIRYVDLKNMFEYGFSNTTTVSISQSEFDPSIAQTHTQITDLLAETNLYIDTQQHACSEYLTIPSSRASLGSTNLIELSKITIDTSLPEQTLKIPLCKSYSDGKTYIVGALTMNITAKAPHIEVDPEKETGWTGLRKVLITVAGISVLLLIVVVALLMLRRSIIKKKRRERYLARSKKL